MNIGTHLREARERRGITLRQLANSTKLSTTALQLIERNEFDRLPGGIFTKGYLRAFSADVGVNPEEVVNEYLLQFPAAQATEELPIVPPPAIEDAHAGQHFLTAVVTIVVGFVVSSWFHDSVEPSVTSSRDVVQTLAPIASRMTASADGPGAFPASGRDELGLHLEIQSKGACWMSARADGRLIIYRLLQSGERVTVVARDELVLRIGDPEMFTYTLNGVWGRPLGEAGIPVTVTITEHNYQTFLADPAPEAPQGVPADVT